MDRFPRGRAFGSKGEEDLDQIFLAAKPWNAQSTSTMMMDESYATTAVGSKKSVAHGLGRPSAVAGGSRPSVRASVGPSGRPSVRPSAGGHRSQQSLHGSRTRMASSSHARKTFREAGDEWGFSGSSPASSVPSARATVGHHDINEHEAELRRRQSVDTFLRERILYHGPVPYMEGYYETRRKYAMPLPKPPRRIRPKVDVSPIAHVELKAVGSDDSDISLTMAATKQEPIFGADEANVINVVESRQQHARTSIRPSEGPKPPDIIRFNPTFVRPPPSAISITEKLCQIEQEKVKPVSLRDRYGGAKRVPGHPTCLDKSTTNPICLAPGEIARRAIKTDVLWGIPTNVPLSKEELISLMRKIEEYPMNDYVCLVYSLPTNHPNFNPYSLKVVKFKEVNPKRYFTMSKYGMMLFTNGFGEFIPMLQFEKHMHLFDHIRKIPFFIQYRLWKSFNLWHTNIRHSKIRQYRKLLDESLFLTKRPLRMMLMELLKMIEKFCTVNILAMKPHETYSLRTFLAHQDRRLKEVYKKLRRFEEIVVEMTVTACRSTLVEAGFSPDQYPEEMQYYMKAMEVPLGDLLTQTVDVLNYPGQWLSYSLQLQKRKLCARLTNFVHLVDYYMQAAYARVYKNSMLSFMCELSMRVKEIPEEFFKAPEYIGTLDALRDSNEKANGAISISYANEPVFDIGCGWTVDNLIFSPTRDKFLKMMRSMMHRWEKAIYTYKNFWPRPIFEPYSQPIINGSMSEKTTGDGPQMSVLLAGDPELRQIRDIILAAFDHGFDVCRTYIEKFDYIRTFCVTNQSTNLKKFRHEKDVQVFADYLKTFHSQMQAIEKIENDQRLGLYRMNNGVLRDKAAPTVKRCIVALNHVLPQLGAKNVKKLAKKIRAAQKVLDKYPDNADEYVDYLNYLDNLIEQMDGIQQELDVCTQIYDLIEMYQIPCPSEDIAAFEKLNPSLSQLHQIIDLRVENRDMLTGELIEKFKTDAAAIFAEMADIRAIAEAPEVLDPATDPIPMREKLTQCRDRLNKLQERAAKFNNYQRQLKLEVTNYDALDALALKVRLRHQLWDSVTTWEDQKDEWFTDPFNTLDPDDLTREVNKFVKSVQQLEKGLPENKVVPKLKEKVVKMRARLPIIVNLHNPNLKRRHWDVLETAMGRNLTDDEVTLESLIEETKIEDFAQLIQDVSAQASAEYSLEALLKKVEDAWKEIEFIVLPHKDQRDNFILGGTDDIQVLLDDSLINMATIASSRHVGPIKHKVDEWTRLLDLFGRTLEEWQTFQRNYIYLETIFCAPDIQRQLPTESKLFTQVDKMWRDIMQKTNRMPAALRAATAPGLLEQLQTGNQMLEQIMKCLDDYLESKRVVFPRFYFLSNEELLEILAQTRNPAAVQPHLRKCFDAIQRLEFGGGGVAVDVLAMFSPEEERVALTKGLKARGNVEEWLGKVEESMVLSLKKCMRNALADYHVYEREEWLQKFPSQCVLTISQLMWAQKVHAILDAPGNKIKGMKDFETENFENLNKLAAIVRGQLKPLVRAVLCAVITIDVHARDIITSLVEKKVDTSSNFEWLKQLRYYWDAHQEVALAKMANAQYFYGYEYLGASPRLVITPLTDRCYLCLMGALQLDLGGAPAGPAGTGKTETTKDLAKSLAFMCVVFNCSEGLDFKMMGRFFAGLAQSGGWCCFDEFNRIDIEVLSVIAQQLITIRLAKVAKVNRFMFEGREIKLVKTCAAFITMNPGYAGRTELPDNLKSLFRPISMMVPDYTLIAEVILYSEGFESSKTLANKMTQMYKLCSEQLSQQDHYDFGMRAVKSVLVMAGSLKRSNPDINENVVLIRALRDSNSAKFLAADNILFNGIIQDLFPGVVIPEQDYGVLQKEAIKNALAKGLQTPECFIRKLIQFFDTMVVRHGVMLVGPTGGGKTSIYETLKMSLASLFSRKVDGPFYRQVDTFVLNPKAISLGELYGEVNPLTLEWRDGLFGVMFRTAVKPKATYNQWIVCDGPVDAIWIENLNTVLDDNKMLCLANSERIKLTNWVRMVFEVQDLSQASPATVSRCGMVYVDPVDMGWHPFVESWLQKLQTSRDDLKPYLQYLFEKHLDLGLQFVKKSCQEIMPQATLGKVSMVCSVLLALLTKRNIDYNLEKSDFMQVICQAFMFAYLWSVGGNIHEKDHDKFSQFVRSQFEKEEYCKLPETGQLWSYYINLETRQLELWDNIMPKYLYNPMVSFVDVLVPTIDTVRFGFLMELLLEVNRAVLFTGPTGTGKSAIAKYVLTSISPKYNYVPVFINFSAQTTSKRTQEMIEGKLEKRKKALLSAPMGKKVIVLIDDINMPKLDRYGSQPSIELVRQLLDFNGCYDRNKLFWKELQNVIISAACAPPGGGRNAITPRLLRHFCMLAIPTPNETVLTQIYRAVLKGFLEQFDPEIRAMTDSIVAAAIQVYQFMTKTFLPTPSKSHYMFNMRDLSKCIQGILQANTSVVVMKKSMVRLFYHEAQRVFHDRLTDFNDQTIFCNSLAELCTKAFDEPIDAEGMKGLVYGDFMKMGTEKEYRVYDEIPNKDKLKQVLNDYLDEYNISTPKEMQLVFFDDAIEHVARIARILRTDRGNALLVGVGGCGKQSLTRLSAYVCGYRCLQIELMRGYDYAAFHDDLKVLYEIAGMHNEQIVFLFTDTQIAYEEFLEDINNILNSGEVPNLLDGEDLEKMMAPVRPDAKREGIAENDRDAVYDFFIRRIRSNLHIVLCMSPVGDNFRIRTRMFPSIINCCTIDWYNDWPTEALLSVARNFMSKIELKQGVTPDMMADICVLVHESVTKMAEKYYLELKRRYYITPSSYLELINLYISMLHERREKIRLGKARIRNGLDKLLETNELVKKMRKELSDFEPILIQKSDAVQVLMVKLAEDQAQADIVRKRVLEEEAVAKQKAIETQEIAEDAQNDLAVALPALNAAAEALNSLDKNDINEIRSFIKPPPLVKLVMSSVCALFGVKEDWNSAKILLTDAAFLKKLLNYDAGKVSDAKLKALKPYIDDPKFLPNIVEKVSKACKCICLWARAVNEYAKVNKIVEPKRKRYEAAQAELDEVMATLRKAQEDLNAVEKKIANLEKIYQNTLREKQELEEKIELTAARLRRAAKLTSALASEQERWLASIKQFDADTENLVGDVFVGAACVAYIGAFSHNYRQVLLNDWRQRCVDLGLPLTKNFTLVTFADPYEIRVWNSHGLPRDYTSTENAILATRGRRWPLMIDPQDQANRWVKQTENERGLKVMRLTDANFMRTMENCVRLGQPALLEEIGETLDPSLEPILLRQTFTQAGRLMIRLGDTNVDYDTNFRFYITTKMANPLYLPEVCIKVTLINFTVTLKGLEDQLLGDVVGIERSDLELQRQKLVTQINFDKNQLVTLEDKILRLLFQSEGNILDDEELINTLNESKETSTIIVKRLADAEIAEEAITIAREKYRPIAGRGSVLYFVVAQLAELDPMYQYSLKYFTQVFNNCIATTPPTEDLEERLRVLKKETTLATYINISRGLFEKDKLVFSFILCTDIMKSNELITDDEWNFFLRGGIGIESLRKPKPAYATWISKPQWNNICDLENTFDFMAKFSNSCLNEAIKIRIGSFKTTIYEPRSPTDKKKTNDKWDKTLSKFQKLILIKSIAEERLVGAITEFVNQELGPKFIESPTIDLDVIFQDLSNSTPLIFVLSVGSDPMASFYRFASEQGVSDRVHAISLGQGQGPIAEGMIKAAAMTGDWVFLQNCHLASSWLPQLERIVKRMNEFNEDISDHFRLFLSSMPTSTFPVSILQESVKVTNEPPKGIRANVRRALLDMEREFFEDHILAMDWKRIIFGICVFHAVTLERKKFGPLGWNIKYEFNDSDRQCCLLNLEMFCKDGTIPWDALEYITGQITYGGRITDPWDQRTVSTILKTFFSKPTLDPKHKFSPSGIYYAPSFLKLAHYLKFVEKFPIIDEPEIFGMHQNANISFQMQESNAFLNAILSAQPRVAGGSAAASNDEIVYDLAVKIESKLPSKFDVDKGNTSLFKPDSKGRTPSMSVFLQQEVDRFNRLIGVMKTSLEQLKKGIKGLVVMSEDLERMYLAFINNQVPDTWTRVSYGSTKTLGSWVNDFLLRIIFLNGWLTGTTPPTSFWLSGFFFQQGFLTAVLQTFARKYSVPIDQLKFVYAVQPIIKEQRAELDPAIEKAIVRPRDGVFIHGLFLEAARWNMADMKLDDALPAVMNSIMPIIHFLPVQNPQPQPRMYNCPLYKTPVRAGVLSTTGHSTNFIVAIDLKTEHDKDYWILNGTALLSQLTD